MPLSKRALGYLQAGKLMQDHIDRELCRMNGKDETMPESGGSSIQALVRMKAVLIEHDARIRSGESLESVFPDGWAE